MCAETGRLERAHGDTGDVFTRDSVPFAHDRKVMQFPNILRAKQRFTSASGDGLLPVSG